MSSNIGPKIAIEGEAQFKKAITEINTSLKTMGTEMKAVTSAYDKGDKSIANLTAQNKVLNKQIDEQKKKLTELNSMLDKSKSTYGENAAETQRYQQQVNLATAELNKMEAALRSNTAAMDEGVTAAQKYEQQMNKFNELGESVTKAGKVMTIGLTAPLVAGGAAAFKFAADLQDAIGATDQVFGQASAGMQDWANNLASYYGIARGEALEYGNMMGSMLQNIGGLTEQQAAKQAQTLIELAGDLSAMYGGTTADAVRALTGALKGNNTMLDNYGMAANDAMIKTKALEMGIYSGTGQMDLATKQAATLALIMEQSGAAQGQAGREADGASGSMKSFATEIKNLATSFGEVLLPVVTPVIAGINKILESFNQLSETDKKIIVTMAAIVAAIGPVLLILGQVFSVIGTVSGAMAILHGSTMVATPAMAGLASVMGVLKTAFAGAAASTAASTAATGAHTIATTASTIATKIAAVAQGIFNVVMTANPIFKVVAALAALGAVLYVVIKYWENITSWITKAWDALTKFNKTDVKDKYPGVTGAYSPLTKGYATGTASAMPGWHWVGENGPELVNFRGGEKVLNAAESMAASGQTLATNSTITPQPPVNVTLLIDGKLLARYLHDPLKAENSIRGAVFV